MHLNGCLTAAEDIRLQYRYSKIKRYLRDTTHFNETEILRLLSIHYMITKKRNRKMDSVCFAEFMNYFLDVKDSAVVNAMFHQYATYNSKYLNGPEFVQLMSLLLKGSLNDKISFCFKVYTEVFRLPNYIKKEDVLSVIKSHSLQTSKKHYSEDFDKEFVELMMVELDMDQDNRISQDDYKNAVTKNRAWLQFLGPVFPEPNRAIAFLKTFTNRLDVETETSTDSNNRGDRESIGRSKSSLTNPMSLSTASVTLTFQSSNTRDNNIPADNVPAETQDSNRPYSFF